MKLILGISSGVLLVCLFALGAFFFLQNSKKNSIGSMIKDKDLETCMPLDTVALQEKVSARIAQFENDPESFLGNLDDDASMRDMLNKEIMDNFDGQTKYCLSEQQVLTHTYGPLIEIVENSLKSARSKAQLASMKASMSSTAPAVILCIDDGEFVNEPSEGRPICGTGENYGPWPNLSDMGGSWGGCEMTVDRENFTFEYCATLPTGIAKCTTDGCAFPQQ